MFKTTAIDTLKQDKKCQACWYIILSTMSGSTTPMVEIYMDIVVDLEHYLEEKAKSFAFSLITELGQRVPSHSEHEVLSGKEKLMVGLERGVAIDYILKDKQFIEFVRPIKEVFDTGCKQFS